MTHTHCLFCGAEISAGDQTCPICGERLPLEEHGAAAPRRPGSRRTLLPTIIGGILLFIAFSGGVLFNLSANKRLETPVATPELVETLPPVPTPSPTPTVESIRIFAFGRELDADGFTAYVGDKPFTLSIELDREVQRPVVSWTILDSRGTGESASLSVSDDGMSCEFSALKPTGKNELTVRCFGAEVMIPVYLWER